MKLIKFSKHPSSYVCNTLLLNTQVLFTQHKACKKWRKEEKKFICYKSLALNYQRELHHRMFLITYVVN